MVLYGRVKCGIVIIIFIEPGYYEDGSFGIRIESLLVTVKASTEVKYSDHF